MPYTVIYAALAFASLGAVADIPAAPLPQFHHSIAIDTVNMAQFAGFYKGSGGQVDQALIEMKEGRLYATAAGVTTELLPSDLPDVFTENNYGAVITFMRNEQKVVDRLQLVVDQMQLNVTLVKQ